MVAVRCGGVGDAGRCVDGVGIDVPVLVFCFEVHEHDACIREWQILVGEVALRLHLGVEGVADHGMVGEVVNVAPVVAV